MLVNRGDVELLEVFPAECDPARAWVVEAQHEMHHSRLATARAADERAHAPLLDDERHALKHFLLRAHLVVEVHVLESNGPLGHG